MNDQTLQNKIKLTGKIFPNLIHSIRNPLAVLKLNHYYLKLLRESLPYEVVNSLNDCTEAALRIEKIIETYSLLSYNYNNVVETSSINDLSNFAIEVLGVSAKRKNIQFETNYDPNIPHLQLDKSKILQVLLNILSYFDSWTNCKKVTVKSDIDESNHIVWQAFAHIENTRSNESKEDISEFNNDLQLCEKLLSEDNNTLLAEINNEVYSKFSIIFTGKKKEVNIEV
jgi:nitrogen-specific signal transduction histidine kinase